MVRYFRFFLKPFFSSTRLTVPGYPATKVFMKLDPPSLATFIDLLRQALAEDVGSGDLTSLTLIDKDASATGTILAGQPGVLAGLFLLEPLAELISEPLTVQLNVADGQLLQPGQEVARLQGSCRGLLAVERVALNFLAHLSGVATLTHEFVQAVEGTSSLICDTRKTIPGLRTLEKYAVRAGGGHNHRLGLYDSALIKDNHLLCLTRGTKQADIFEVLEPRLKALRKSLPAGGFIQLELDNLQQFQRVLDMHLDLDMVLLDNFSPQDLAQAVKMRNQAQLTGKLLLEASGNVTLDSVSRIAATGVDRISVGALTHSAPAFDFSMEFIQK